MSARLLHADAILVGDGTSIRDGAIVLDGDVILDVGAADAVRARATGARVERVDGVVMPGLVNAHTHLELSGLRGRTPSGAGFVPWLDALQRARAEELEEERDAAIDRAIAALVEAGVVGVGEVTNTLAAWPRLARRFVGTVFHEVFALDAGQGRARIAEAIAARDANAPPRDGSEGAMRWTLAPHALYSTHPEVVGEIVRHVVADDAPLAIHLAEHAAERAFLRDGGGPLPAFYAARGLAAAAKAFPIPGTDPIAAARGLGLLRPGSALVHLADARPDELDAVAEHGSIAVLCPRSNLHIETRYPPLLALLSRGIVLALGTDSLASSPSLDPLAEAKALADRTPEVPAASLVSAATNGAARAIGWGDRLGLLAKGRAPGVLHVATARVPGDVDPAAWVLRSLSSPRRLLAKARAS